MSVGPRNQHAKLECVGAPLGEGTIVPTPVGSLAIGRRGGYLVADWLVQGAIAPSCADDDQEVRELAAKLRRFFDGDLTALDAVPTGHGTAFQRSVWTACRSIPFGETRTYLWIAGELQSGLRSRQAYCRAIGQALRRNPLPVVVPCHRVVSSIGLGGYAGEIAGELPAIKQGLLDFEARDRGRLLDCVPSPLREDRGTRVCD